MTPPRRIADEIDRLVDALDEATLPERPTFGRATAGFADICAQWDRLMVRVNAIDAAIAQPFTTTAPSTLQQAGELVEDDVFRLSHRLVRVGEALAQRPV